VWLRAAVLTGALTAALAAGCGGGGPGTPDRRSGPFRPTDKVDVGQLGALPPSQAPRAGPRLVLPAPALTVPGRFPLNRLVVFRVPLRNDGTRALRIEKIDPG
jgi:hypothetical protein